MTRTQASRWGRDFKFVGQIDPADARIVGVDPGQQTLVEETAERMAREVRHGACLNIAREVRLNTDPALAQHLHHGGVIHCANGVTDSRGAEFFDSLDDALRPGGFACMNGDLPTRVPTDFEMLHKKARWF